MIRRLSIVILCLVSAGLFTASTRSDRAPGWDALLLSSFDRGDATDRSYSNRSPTVSSGATFPSGYRVVDFDGTSNSAITFPDSSDFEGAAISVVFWARLDSASTRVSLAGKCVVTAGATQYRGWYVHFIGTGAGSFGMVWNTGTDASNYISIYTGNPSTYGDGTWRHYGFTRDVIGSSTNWKIYANGSAVSTSLASAGTVSTIDNAELLKLAGQTTANQTSYMNGALDDVRIFNRVLTAAEIAAIYAEGIGASRP